MNTSLSQLAKLTKSKLVGDPDLRITAVENLEEASSDQISFLDSKKYYKQMISSKAGAIIVHPDNLPKESSQNFLLNESPSLAFQTIIEHFISPIKSGFSSIHPTCVIHESAQIGKNVSIAPYTVIDQGVEIGEGCEIGPHVTIGPKTTLGHNCVIHSHVTIREGCYVGDRVTIQPGAVIGSCGFGYFTDKKGKHHPYKQLGNVILEDDVSIGANTTIDRARFKTTRIGKGTKVDNLVQIAHQVQLGEDNMIVSQVGIAGSTKTGIGVVMGGQAGVAGHITIADRTILTARCAVSKSLEKADVYYGAPALPSREFKQQFIALKRVEKMVPKFKELEKKFAHLLDDDEDDDED
ncbi:MAG: UDP-3-O-acylglucosamine N-acyltransferase [Chlamydiales bacterium]|nr:UDP-3-O-acylglucosamine N-acyltransferase [Chlamydiales bacterium]MCH9620140.1 UDP-3-O-acylglucosamine N-acyltransferase [Chlamydiales bacterium]MCH9623610.1 UDP-3-O-acylglucosamine N-acyltransferase [Chlamydiales bacterium]